MYYRNLWNGKGLPAFKKKAFKILYGLKHWSLESATRPEGRLCVCVYIYYKKMWMVSEKHVYQSLLTNSLYQSGMHNFKIWSLFHYCNYQPGMLNFKIGSLFHYCNYQSGMLNFKILFHTYIFFLKLAEQIEFSFFFFAFSYV